MVAHLGCTRRLTGESQKTLYLLPLPWAGMRGIAVPERMLDDGINAQRSRLPLARRT